MNLVIDIGNTRVKAALFDEGRMTLLPEGRMTFLPENPRGPEMPEGPGMAERFPRADRTIVVSTAGRVPHIDGALVFDRSTPVPVKNLYGTPGTLGYDRLAAAAGAAVMFPGQAVLIVDFGTAITFDVVTAAAEYLGGNISPGAGSRFRSLHDYTGSLPLLHLPSSGESGEPGGPEFPTGSPTEPPTEFPSESPADFPARTTRQAIENGVVEGIVAETESYISKATGRFGDVKIIFTGGDADYFAGRVNFPIFAVPDLVLHGLNAILEHNANL